MTKKHNEDGVARFAVIRNSIGAHECGLSSWRWWTRGFSLSVLYMVFALDIRRSLTNQIMSCDLCTVRYRIASLYVGRHMHFPELRQVQ